jgi:hypothetical protein
VTPLGGLELSYVKGASAASAAAVQGLFAVAELIGTFGPEDQQAGDAAVLLPAMVGIHNAPYPRTPWARKGAAPIGAVVIHAGTYVGNGTATTLNFRTPVHFLSVRPLTGAAAGFQWTSAAVGPHVGGDRRVESDIMPVVEIDEAFVPGGLDAQEQQTRIRLVGTNVNSNANGVTYQYLAVSDPAMRFLVSGALWSHVGTDAFVSGLDNEGFTPEAAFLFREVYAATAAGNTFFKGIGHAADNLSPLSAAELASGLTFGLGTLTSRSAFHVVNLDQVAYALFRRHDGNADAGEASVLALSSYVGDGSASRTVNLAPASGKRPLWAIVVPHNAASVFRDPSHTGTTSTTFPVTANAATGITGGGIDSLSVGSALNANGVIHDVFVFLGSATAGNGGWSVNGEFVPVEPNSPVDGPWDDEPTDPEAVVGDGTGGGGTADPSSSDGDSVNFAAGCVVASTGVINRALSHLGINKRILAITTELSAEAAEARLHYSEDVDGTLRDFPWPFATRYATLTRVAGTATAPVNGDWQYSYRTPANMMLARRILNPNRVGRGFDPHPVEFRLGADDTGTLIYTNEAAPDLEYTVRPSCAASQGDPLFRSALAWRHAHSLAPALARDEKKTAFCWMMYQQILGTAEVKSSSEMQQAPAGEAGWISDRA